MGETAVVIIGRNEGKRIIGCIESVLAQLAARGWAKDRGRDRIVYVDSGSTDGSCETVREYQVAVVELDAALPFTAARARNAGLAWLNQSVPGFSYVQFIDGDCELSQDWFDQAIPYLDRDPSLAVVCGRRREREPDASSYNRLADMEWDTPVGKTSACGGDALIRTEAIQAVGGYNPALICGEEPEMCIRLRCLGWKIERICAEMTLHDAAMYRLGQWWKRSVRGGWAVAEGFAMYGSAPERYMAREHFSGWLWGLIIPSLAVTLAWPTRGLSLLLLLGYVPLALRIYRYRRAQFGDLPAHARLYAVLCTLSKFPQAAGQVFYWLTRWRGQAATLIEYKSPGKEGAEL